MSELRGLHLHFDVPSGIAGDMTLGALFDLGVPVEVVRAELARLPVSGYELTVARTLRRGMAGTDVKVRIERQGRAAAAFHAHPHEHAHAHGAHAHGDHAHPHDHGDHAHPHAHGDHAHPHDHGDHAHGDHAHGDHAHHHYGAIRRMLAGAGLGPDVLARALAMFDRVADAEAKIHGVTVEEVAFHEVGAVDSIVDIVGTAAALAWLAPAGVTSAPVPLGSGTLRCAHGILPVPAPAALEILRAAGAPVVDGGLARELCTPTGAAILAASVDRFGPMPPLVPVAIGYGAGDDDFPDRPNLLRAVVGRPLAATASPDADDVVELAANIDDMNPELCEHVTERLLAAGALDVWWTPITMKKSRPALVLGVLAPAASLDGVAAVVLTETTSIGLRVHPVRRRVLERRVRQVETPFGPVDVKLALRDGGVANVAPEYESCRARARATGAPLKEIYAAALTAARQG